MGAINSVEYAARATLGVLADGRDANSKLKEFYCHVVIPTSPGAAPTFPLFKVPQGFKPSEIVVATDGLSASAGVNLLVRIGDGGDGTNVADDNRLMDDTDCDVSNRAVYDGLDLAGWGFEYLAETLIVATVSSGKTPVVGKILHVRLRGTVIG